MEFCEKNIYKTVSNYYKGKGLSNTQFSNRLRAVNMLIEKEYPMADAIYWLLRYENDFFEDKETQNRLKASYRGQMVTILKRLGIKRTREGLEVL